MAWTVRAGSRKQTYGTRRVAEDLTRDMAAWRKRAVMYDPQGQPAFVCEKKASEVFCKTLDSGLGGRRWPKTKGPVFPRIAILVDAQGQEIERGTKIATLRKKWQKLGAKVHPSYSGRGPITYVLSGAACWNVNDTACFERERRRRKREGLLGSPKKRRRR